MAPQPAAIGGANPQILQYLSNVLSQRGPAALPYPEDVKWLIRQHLLSLTTAFPSLLPKTAAFTHNDGCSVNLLHADGTLPMPYHGVTYNIPIIIWLTESYPRHPPRVYLNPTRDMIIKQPHSNVVPSGLVTVPYLQKWVYPSSNLVDLARELIHFFALDPPVYSRGRASPSSSSFNSSGNPAMVSSNSMGSGFSGSVQSSSGARPSIPPRDFPPSPYVGSGRIVPPSPQRVGTDDPSEVFKRNSINKLVEMIHGDIVALNKSREGEMDGLFNAQAALRQRNMELEGGLREMQGEKEGLEQQLQVVLTNVDVLGEWLEANEGKIEKLGKLDVDEVFEPRDALSRQMLECMASDLAIEDVIYSLDKGVQEGVVTIDMYLRNVRLLSREQFLHRATAAKVRAAQMQAQGTAMASRMPQFTA
ncbi:hypothetical protein Dimus_034141 [Dionaea muscipula]